MLRVNPEGLAAQGIEIEDTWVEPLHLPTFARMLAKIAHAYICAELGFGSFDAFVPALIGDESNNPYFLVGGELDVPPPPKHYGLHSIDGLIYPSLDGTMELIGARIRLFAKYGAPVYTVIVGGRKIKSLA